VCFANPDAPTSSADQQIADLQKQLEIAKLKAAIAQASATPTYHHANVRFTVGYTLPDYRIYALVMKVL
jgi:hypothetical protein